MVIQESCVMSTEITCERRLNPSKFSLQDHDLLVPLQNKWSR
jgi:hypothetical protein